MAQGLGISEDVTSPTFSLINVYNSKLNLYHMDLYRIHSPEEFELIGGLEYLDGQGVCLVEWSEIIQEYIPDHARRVEFQLLDHGRIIRFSE